MVRLGPVVPRAVGRLALSPEETGAQAGGRVFGDTGCLRESCHRSPEFSVIDDRVRNSLTLSCLLAAEL